MVEPRYIHNCEKCRFLGTYEEYDLYVHGEGKNPELFVRYSNTHDGYSVDDAQSIRPGIHKEAKIRAHILALGYYPFHKEEIQKQKQMNDMEKLQIELMAAQDKVIGLFRPPFAPKDSFYPVTEVSKEGNITCINVGRLLGLVETSVHMSQGLFIRFPDGKSLFEMLETPSTFFIWYKENVEIHYKTL